MNITANFMKFVQSDDYGKARLSQHGNEITDNILQKDDISLFHLL